MRKKINNNDLIPWFTQNHADLPPAYLASCQKFFDELQKGYEEYLFHSEIQASSVKPQASSFKQQALDTSSIL
jgi:hypothetical protein